MTANRKCPKCGTVSFDDALEGLCRKCLGDLAFGAALEPSESHSRAGMPRLRQFGDYELLGEIARGGMGVVYKARQVTLNRIVALKVVLHGPFSSEAFVRRFQIEAQAAAGLKHPNIVVIYEVGEHDGHHFFSMEYVEGQNLADLVKEKPLPARRAAVYLKTIAEAVHYAHQRGVLHRDLKPSNLLLDAFDQPRITDFGLAKLLGSEVELTTTGEVLGSPSHMPPEQAAGKFAEATPRSDVYSLGAILYHLITARPPFQADTLQAVLSQVQNTPPVEPRRLNPGVPHNLQTICLKCLQKEPSHRYGSAKELAEDLARLLDDKPILASPVPAAERLWLWCRRRPLLAALSAALAAAVLLGFTGIIWQWRRAEQHALGESRERRLAEEQTAKVRLNLYAVDVNLASQAMRRGDYGLARRTLAGLRPESGERDLRGFEWRYLWNLCRGGQIATLAGHKWIVTCADFSPDGKLIASGSQDGTARIWDVEKRTLVTALLGSTNKAVWSVGFSPDGRILMTAGYQAVRFWSVESWQPIVSIPGEIAVLSKTRPIVAVSESSPFYYETAGRVSVWDYQTGERLRQFEKPGRAVALSPDDQKLAVAGVSKGIDLWDVPSGRLLQTLGTDEPVWSLSFSPDGNKLVAAGWSSEVLIWDLNTRGPPSKLNGHSLTVWSARFSPDGSAIVSAGSDQTVRLWDPTTLQLTDTLRGHGNEVWCATFSPDGKTLVTGGKDKNVLLWSAQPHASARSDDVPNLSVRRPMFSPDGTRIVTTTGSAADARSSIWNVADRSPFGWQPECKIIGFSTNGRQFISWNTDETALLAWTPEEHTPKRIPLSGLTPDPERFNRWGFSPAGEVFFAVDRTGLVRLWDARNGNSRGLIQGPEPPIRGAALGPGGKYLALSVERENIVRFYDCTTRGESQLTGHYDFVSGLAFSPDSSLLASGSMDGTIGLWSTVTGQQLAVLPGHMEEVTDVAFSPDGRTLASVGHRESVKLWHLATHRELLSLDFARAGLFLQFSPDGRHLAVTTDDNSVRILDAPELTDLGRRNP